MGASQPEAGDHAGYLRLCLDLARESPALPTNFRVGAVLVHAPSNRIISTGYTNERPGNTHAEQVCLIKLAERYGVDEEDVGAKVPEMAGGEVILYSTVEPCTKRLSGNTPCVRRILGTKGSHQSGILAVYVGVSEPKTFVTDNNARAILEGAHIKFEHIRGMEDEILQVATTGHQ